MANVNASELLARGMRTEFTETYSRMIRDASPHLAEVMNLNIPSDKLSEIFGYYESAPHFSIWRRGEALAGAAFQSRSFIVDAKDWGTAVEWNANDEEDDQTHGLMDRVRQCANDAAILPERVFFQMILGSVNNSLLPNVPNAPDGAAWFATTAGGVARFGVTGGNIQSTSGVASTGAIQNDFFGAYNRLLRFLDTAGLPLLPPGQVAQGLKVTFGALNLQVFQQAFWQSFNALSLAGGVAAPSNPILDGVINLPQGGAAKVSLWPTPYITTDVWSVCATGVTPKAPFQTVRQAVRDNLEDFLNSDTTRRTKIKRMQWDARYGYGLGATYGWVGVQ